MTNRIYFRIAVCYRNKKKSLSTKSSSKSPVTTPVEKYYNKDKINCFRIAFM